jgi:hypothetical protein
MEQIINQSQPIPQPLVNNPLPISQTKKSSFPIILVLLIVLILLVGLGSFLLGKSLSQPKTAETPTAKAPPTISPITPTVTAIITTSVTTTPIISPAEPSETVPAGWKVSQGINDLYQVKIPATWNSKPLSDSQETILFSPEPIKIIPQSEGPFVPITIRTITGTEIDKEVVSYKESYQYKNFKEENIIVDGVSSKKISGTIGADGYFTDEFNSEVFIPKNGKIIQISFFKRLGVSEQFFDQFLSTFKWLLWIQ